MTGSAAIEIHRAPSLASALDALAEAGTEGAAFAGGTWIMRSPLRREAFRPAYVALCGIAELKRIAFGEAGAEIGACVTHAELASALAGRPGWEALAQAAGQSANPAVREAATIGGNLATPGFFAADLVPALLALGAEVKIAERGGTERTSVEAYLAARDRPAPGRLLTRILLPRPAASHGAGPGARSAHARLPLRKAGDYPVAVVSLSVVPDAKGRIESARVAVGSVEPVARRWPRLEAALAGQALDPGAIADLAKTLAGDFTGRDGVEAPGWYRVSVLPTLVRRAAASLLALS